MNNLVMYHTDFKAVMNLQKFRTPLFRNHTAEILFKQIRQCTNQSSPTEEEKQKEIERISINASIDDPPTACCRTGCANCVFIVWAEALSKKMQDAGPEITDKVLKKVDDPSMRAYLEMELRLLLKKQQ